MEVGSEMLVHELVNKKKQEWGSVSEIGYGIL